MRARRIYGMVGAQVISYSSADIGSSVRGMEVVAQRSLAFTLAWTPVSVAKTQRAISLLRDSELCITANYAGREAVALFNHALCDGGGALAALAEALCGRLPVGAVVPLGSPSEMSRTGRIRGGAPGAGWRRVVEPVDGSQERATVLRYRALRGGRTERSFASTLVLAAHRANMAICAPWEYSRIYVPVSPIRPYPGRPISNLSGLFSSNAFPSWDPQERLVSEVDSALTYARSNKEGLLRRSAQFGRAAAILEHRRILRPFRVLKLGASSNTVSVLGQLPAVVNANCKNLFASVGPASRGSVVFIAMKGDECYNVSVSANCEEIELRTYLERLAIAGGSSLRLERVWE